MRAAFCRAMVALSGEKPFVFFTGDLGFSALEPLRDAMGDRFVNAGVAEQNMITAAAGAASVGEQCWAYSIAPFIYARPFEQIRNDVCVHDSDVKLVGNGGGFTYGVMGSTHHALEDYGILCGLPHMKVYVPAFADDVDELVPRISAAAGPAYLRLGRCEKPAGIVIDSYAPWRCVLTGQRGVLLAIGPGAGALIAHAAALPPHARPSLWVVGELPIRADTIPQAFLSMVENLGSVAVYEEHVAHGGVGQMLAYALMENKITPRAFCHFHAKGYVSGRYGSQAYHRRECELDAASVFKKLAELA